MGTAESVLVVPRNLRLKFGQKLVSNSCYIAVKEFLVGGVGGGGM